jgi:hypothetical protein
MVVHEFGVAFKGDAVIGYLYAAAVNCRDGTVPVSVELGHFVGGWRTR